jgi:hypothetical protein
MKKRRGVMPHVKIDVEEVDRIVTQALRETLFSGGYMGWGDSDKIKEALVIAHNWYCEPGQLLPTEGFE